MTTNDDMNSPEDGGGMMTNDDLHSPTGPDPAERPKVKALILDLQHNGGRQAIVTWMHKSGLVPDGFCISQGLEPDQEFLPVVEGFANLLQGNMIAEHWKKQGLHPDALPILLEALQEAIAEAKATGEHMVGAEVGVRYGVEEPKPKRQQRPTPIVPGGQFLQVASAGFMREVQLALLDSGRFQDGGTWPTAFMQTTPGTIEARPPALDQDAFLDAKEQAIYQSTIWQQVKAMSALDADNLDILLDWWMRRAIHPDQKVAVPLDYLLERRGLQRKKGGTGRRGGHYRKQRMEAWESVQRLQALWLDMPEYDPHGRKPGRRGYSPIPVQGRVLMVAEKTGQPRLDGVIDDPIAFTYHLGSVVSHTLMGDRMQYALLAVKALEYDPFREEWEKALTRYLSWVWRCNASGGTVAKAFRVQTLLDAILQTPNEKDPQRTLERLEKALARLKDDGVIRAWSPSPEWNAIPFGKRGWLQPWLATTVDIEPPDDLPKEYQSILEAKQARIAKALPARNSTDLPARLKDRRLRLCMSCLQVGEDLGVSGQTVGRWENGTRRPSKADQQRILRWLKATE